MARAAAVGLLVAVAVLLALGGPASGGSGAATPPASGTVAAKAGDPGRALFVRMGCGSCHQFAAGAGIGSIGPDLDARLPNYDAASLRAKIVAPYPAGTTEAIGSMPSDFGRRMNGRELGHLVTFLLHDVRD